MKLFGIFVLHKENDTKVKILQKQCDLSSFGYFESWHMESFLVFSARTAVDHTDYGLKQSIDLSEKVDGMVHVYVRSDGLASAIISDRVYPQRVAHNLLIKVMEEFIKIYPSIDSWKNMAEGSGTMTSLNGTLTKYQNPEKADPLMGLQKDLDETKGIMLKTLENVLKRGENLDDLLARSNDLSFETKLLYKKSKDLNRCSCTLL